MSSQENFWWCFVSYRHADNDVEHDRGWASWIHQEIERYEVPAELVGTRNKRGDSIPERIYPVFRDEDSLPSDADLSKSISLALKQSKVLLVLCSPNAVESRYVSEEILEFKKLGREDRIIAAIVSGDPSDENRNPFPTPLLHPIDADGELDLDQVIEPIAADFRLPSGDEGFTSSEAYGILLRNEGVSGNTLRRKIEAQHERLQLMKLKIIAGILGLPLEELHNRDRAFQLELARKRSRKLKTWIAALSIVSLVAIFGGLAAVQQRDRARSAELETQEQLEEVEKQKNRAVIAEGEAVKAEQETRKQLEESRHQLGRVWLERSTRDSDPLASSLHAARALGFHDVGRDSLPEEERQEKYPVLLKKDSGEWRDAHKAIARRRFADPVWSVGTANIEGPYFFSTDSNFLFCRAPNRLSPTTEVKKFDILSGERKSVFELPAFSQADTLIRLKNGNILRLSSAEITLLSPDGKEQLAAAVPRITATTGQRRVSVSTDEKKLALVGPSHYDPTNPQQVPFRAEIYDIATLELTEQYSLENPGVVPSAISLSEDNQSLIYVIEDNLFKRLSFDEGQSKLIARHREMDHVAAIKILSDGRSFAFSRNWNLYYSESIDGEFTALLPLAPEEDDPAETRLGTFLTVSLDESLLAFSSSQSSMKVLNLRSHPPQLAHHEENLNSEYLTSFQFSPNSRHLIRERGIITDTVYLWDTQSWEMRRIRTAGNNPPFEQAVSRQGRYVAWPGKDRIHYLDTWEGKGEETVEVDLPSDIRKWFYFEQGGGLRAGNVVISIPDGVVENVAGMKARSDGVRLQHGSLTDSNAQLFLDESGEEQFQIPRAPEDSGRSRKATFGMADGGELLFRPVKYEQNGMRFEFFDAFTGASVSQIEFPDIIPTEKQSDLSAAGIMMFHTGPNQVELWDANTGSKLSSLDLDSFTMISGVMESNRQFRLSPDGRLIATWIHLQQTVDLFSAASGEKLAQLSAPRQPLKACSFSPDSAYLVTTGDGGEKILWKLERPNMRLRNQKSIKGIPSRLKWVDDDTFLVTGFMLAPTLFDVESATLVERASFQPQLEKTPRRSAGNTGMDLSSLTLVGEEAYLASMAIDDEIHVLDRKNGDLIRTLPTTMVRFPNEMHTLADGKILAVSVNSGISIVDPATFQTEFELGESRMSVFAYPSPDGKWIAGRGRTDSLSLWNISKPGERIILDDGIAGTKISFAAFSRNSETLFTSFNSNSLLEWELSNGEATLTKTHQFGEAPFSVFSLTNDERLVLTGGNSGKVSAWNMDSGEMTFEFETGLKRIVSILSGNLPGQYIVAGIKPNGSAMLMQWSLVDSNERSKLSANYLGELIRQKALSWDEATGEVVYFANENIYTGRSPIERKAVEIIVPE